MICELYLNKAAVKKLNYKDSNTLHYSHFTHEELRHRNVKQQAPC